MAEAVTQTDASKGDMREFCRLSGPGRGDCAHAVGVPTVLDSTTCDAYGIPYGWCEYCWLLHRFDQVTADNRRIRDGEIKAGGLIIQMHAAARGSLVGPRVSVVEDVAELARIAAGLADGLVWASGLPDMGPGGPAHEGWLKAKVWLDRYLAYMSPDDDADADPGSGAGR